MNEIITTIVTSSAVAGVFLFIFKESFKAKLSEIGKDIDALKSYQAKDYDLVSLSMKNIWIELSNIDDYIRHGLSHDIEKGQVSNLPLRPFILAIRKEMALLPADIFDKTDKSLDLMSTHWVKAITRIGGEVQAGRQKEKTEQECMDSVNSYIEGLRSDYNSNLNSLRAEYRSYINLHIST